MSPATGTTPDASSRTRPSARIPGGDGARRVQRVRSGGPDLVGPGQDDDRIDRRGVGDGTVDEGFEELDVRAMEVAHQVDDGVGLARSVILVVDEGAGRPLGRALGGGPKAGRIDERQVDELLRRPADLDPLDRFDREAAEVDVEGAVLALEGELHRSASAGGRR